MDFFATRRLTKQHGFGGTPGPLGYDFRDTVTLEYDTQKSGSMGAAPEGTGWCRHCVPLCSNPRELPIASAGGAVQMSWIMSTYSKTVQQRRILWR